MSAKRKHDDEKDVKSQKNHRPTKNRVIKELHIPLASGAIDVVRYFANCDNSWASEQFTRPVSIDAKTASAANEIVLLGRDGGGDLLKLYPNALSEAESNQLFGGLVKAPSWKRYMSKRMVGVQQPRYITSWTSDVKTMPAYVYSNFPVPTVAYDTSAEIGVIAAKLKGLGADIDYLLGNLYEPADTKNPIDPAKFKPALDDSVDEHADDEKSIDQTRGIWSVSLGDTRRLTIRVSKAVSDETPANRILMTIDMPHGLVLQMCPGMQALTSHAVHKRSAEEKKLYKASHEARVNLTGRKMLPSS
jgi:hypothetical protein